MGLRAYRTVVLAALVGSCSRERLAQVDPCEAGDCVACPTAPACIVVPPALPPPECELECLAQAGSCLENGQCYLQGGAPNCHFPLKPNGAACARGAGVVGECFDGQCVECTTSAKCLDGDGCTTDTCASGQCVHQLVCSTTPSCDGGCAATLNGGCRQNGRCENTSCAYDDAPNGTSCALTASVTGLCHGGQCVQCAADSDCTDSNECTLDSCVSGVCTNTRRHDDETWRLPINPGPEIYVSPAGAPFDAEWDGQHFLVAWNDPSSGTVGAARVSPQATVVDSFPLPPDTMELAFDGQRYLLGRNPFSAEYNTIVPTLAFMSRTGVIAPEWTPLLDCRNEYSYCGIVGITFGGGAYLVLHSGYGYRDRRFDLVSPTGGLIERERMVSSINGGFAWGQSAASFDGTNFVVLFLDMRCPPHNAPCLYGRTVSPLGNNQELVATGMVVHPEADDNYAIAMFTHAAGSQSHLVSFEQIWGGVQVRPFDAALQVDFGTNVAAAGLGASFDRSKRPIFFDRRNFLVTSSTCLVSEGLACATERRVYVSRVKQGGTLLDPAPISLSPRTSDRRDRYPVIASDGHGHHLVAYQKEGPSSGVYARLFSTCP